MREDDRAEVEPVYDSEEFKSAAASYNEELAYRKYASSRVGMAASIPLKEKTEDGRLIWNFHEGQMRIMNSKKRYIIALGGRQSGKCIARGTMVRSANGKYYPIEEFAPGTVVSSYNEDSGEMVSSEVLDVIRAGVKNGYRVTLANGMSITASLDHRFLTDHIAGLEWKRMKELNPEDAIMIFHNGSVSCSPVKAIEPVGPVEMYDLEVEDTHNFVAAGMIVHNSESGPPWLYEEMKARGPGWYMVVAPTYPVLEDSALPKLVDYFQRDLNLGFLRKNPLKFVISEEGERRLWGHSGLLGSGKESVIRFGHGTNASSLEAKTSLGCWIDEGGQPEFRPESYEAIEGRHTTTEGRILVSTTPYDLGYLKKRFFDPWLAAGRNHPTIDIIQWKSIANPAFPREEYDRLKAIMPAWRHAMFYDGEFSVPAGLIYDIVRERESEVSVSPFMIPHNWPRYAGLDFGGVNTAAIFAAMNPYERVLYLYTKFHPGTAGRVRDHADEIRKTAGGHLERVIGGAKSEDNWRDQYYEAGMMVEKPSIPEVHAGIARVYSLFAAGRLKVFNTSCDDMTEWWNEVYTYRYETDATTGETLPDMKIIDQNKFHLMDAMRYLGTGFADMVHPTNIARAGGERSEVESYASMTEALFKAKHPDSGNPYSVGRAGGASGVRRTKIWSPMAREAAFLRARRMR